MPTKEISRSREGKDQRSDSPTKDAASSNRRVGDFATRSETHQYAAHDDLLQQGVGEHMNKNKVPLEGTVMLSCACGEGGMIHSLGSIN